MTSYPRKELLMNLPQEIQNKIGMFNCDHKPMMKIVLEELIRMNFPEKTKEYWVAKQEIIIINAKLDIQYAVFCGYCCNHKPLYLIDTMYCGNQCSDEHEKEIYEAYYDDCDYDDCDYDDFD